jgi:hypothetical protein
MRNDNYQNPNREMENNDREIGGGGNGEKREQEIVRSWEFACLSVGREFEVKNENVRETGK